MGRKQKTDVSQKQNKWNLELPNRTNGTPKQNKWISKTEQMELQFPHPPLYL